MRLKSLLLLLPLLGLTWLASAQAPVVNPPAAEPESQALPGVIMKANLLPLLGNSYNLSFEFGKKPGRTWMVTTGFSAEPPNTSWRYRRAVRLVIDRRFFLASGKRAGSGFYLGPYFRAVGVEADLHHDDDSYYFYLTDLSRRKFIKLGVGVATGYQMVLKNGVVIDFMGGFGTNPGIIGLDNKPGRFNAEYYDGRLGVLIGGVL